MEYSKSEKHHQIKMNPGSPNSNLREEQEDRQRLEKSNFDLKMRNYYLEENLKRIQDGEHTSSNQNESSRSEITSLKLQLEEKNIELDQRNMILMKAKSAIEQLKAELERLRQENEKQHDLENRMRTLKQLNDDIESDYRGKVSQLEIQLAAARQLSNNKEQEKASVEHKLAQLELSFSHTAEKASEFHIDRDKLQEQWLQAQQRISHLEDELTQQRAHVDLYALQLDEQTQEADSLKSKYKELCTMKTRSDEEYKQRTTELNAQYESQIRTMRTNHEQEVERLRDGHVKMLADIRENYQMEISVAKAQLDRSLSEARHSEGQDVTRVRDDCNLRLNEKNEEIRSLRGVIDSERNRTNTLLLELEATRSDLRNKSDAADRLSSESSNKSEELKIAELIRRELTQSRSECGELQELLKREQLDNATKSSRVEQLQGTVESARDIIRDQEASLQTSKAELDRLHRESSELGSRANSVEGISRENEKLRTIQSQLQTEVLELGHRHSDVRRDLAQAAEEIQRLTREVSALKDQLVDSRSDCDTLRGTKENLQMSLQSERERLSGVEASLSEQRAMMSTSRADLEREREGKLRAEQEAAHLKGGVEDMRRNLGSACTMAYRAMSQWDAALSGILEGEMFRDSSSSVITSKPVSSNGQGGGVSALISLFGAKQQNGNYSQSARRPLPVQSAPYGRQREEEEVEQDISSLDADQLLQSVAVRIERVGLKMERAKKIRSLFDAQSQRILQSVQHEFNTVQERSSLLFHKVSEAAGDVSKVKGLLDRDRRHREDELGEMKTFRETLLSEHSIKLRDSEVRHAQLAQQLEQEKHQTERANQVAVGLREEVRVLQSTITELRADLRELEHTEQMVSQLSTRASQLGEVNASLTRDRDAKAWSLEQSGSELLSIKQERTLLLANVERLMVQLQSKDELVQDCEGRLTRSAKEIERLRARQINPELAQTILDTQSILQNTARGGDTRSTSPYHDRRPAERNANSSSSQSALYVEQLQSILEVVQVASDLVDRSGESVSVFESLLNQHGSSSRTHSIAAALEADLSELLEMNSKVAIQVHQVANDLKRAVRRQESKLLTATLTAPSAAPLAPHAYTNTNRSSSPEHRSYQQPVRREEEDRYAHTATSGSNLFGSRATPSQQGSRSFTPSRHSSQPSQYASPSREESKYGREHQSGHQFHHVDSSGSGNILSRADLSPEKDSSSLRGADEYIQSRMSSGGRDYAHHQSQQQVRFGASGSSVSGTPGTASRASASRLTKMSSDLQALASKLDSYDGQQQGGRTPSKFV